MTSCLPHMTTGTPLWIASVALVRISILILCNGRMEDHKAKRGPSSLQKLGGIEGMLILNRVLIEFSLYQNNSFSGWHSKCYAMLLQGKIELCIFSEQAWWPSLLHQAIAGFLALWGLLLYLQWVCGRALMKQGLSAMANKPLRKTNIVSLNATCLPERLYSHEK